MPESEVIRFIQTWLIVYTCLAYTFVIGKVVPSGKLVRSLCILPIVALFLLLPLRLTSLFFCVSTGLLVAWLAAFKLALFSFGKGPLATDYPVLTFSRFLAVGSLPIIISSQTKVVEKKVDPSTNGGGMALAVRALLSSLMYMLYKSQYAQLHPTAFFYIYGISICLSVDFIVTCFRAVTEAVLGLKIDPIFNDPICATSVQNFWGRRWNLAMSNILRASVYDPLRSLLTPHVGSKHAQRLGVLATFATSGVMHEIIFYYISRKLPTWDLTCYFLLQGVTVVVEIDIKRRVRDHWRLPTLVSILLTLSFMAGMGLWYIFPQIYYHYDCNVRANEEIAAFMAFLNNRSGVGAVFRSLQDHATVSHFFQQIVSY